MPRGRLPRGTRLGRAKLWLVDELRAWLAAGAPSATSGTNAKLNPGRGWYRERLVTFSARASDSAALQTKTPVDGSTGR